MKRNRFLKTLWKDKALHMMLFFPVILTIIYKYMPMPGIIMAFQNYKPSIGILGSQWVGIDNFKLLFSMQGFVNAIKNTIIIATFKIILGVIVPVVFSLLINEMMILRIKKIIQTIVYLPHFISWVLMAVIIIKILSQYGIANQFLKLFGSGPIIFLTKKEWFQFIIIITDIWKEFGYGTIIYFAAICGVSPSLYEAATVDGAGYWKRTLHVTLPSILPMILLMTALSLGRILDAGFEQIFNLYSPVVYQTGDIIDTFIYRMAFYNFQFSISTAAGLFKSAISFILIVLSYRIAYATSGYRLF